MRNETADSSTLEKGLAEMEKCNILHEQKQENGNAKDQANAKYKKGGGVFGKRQKQQLASMVATELKKCTKEMAKKIKKKWKRGAEQEE